MYVFPEFPRSLQRDEFHFQRYIKFIDDRSRRIIPEGTYIEKHHKVPKSFEGADTTANLIKLTGREHYIAHLLLHKAFKGKMSTAFLFMETSGRFKSHITSRQFAELREAASKEAARRMLGTTRPPEVGQKISKANKGRKESKETKEKRRLANQKRREAGYDWSHSLEVREKISKGRRANPITYTKNQLARRAELSTGRKHTDQTKAKMSNIKKDQYNALSKEQQKQQIENMRIANTGRKRKPGVSEQIIATKKANKTLTHSEETKEKMRKSSTGKKHSAETKAKLAEVVRQAWANLPEEEKQRRKEKRLKTMKENKRKKQLENNS